MLSTLWPEEGHKCIFAAKAGQVKTLFFKNTSNVDEAVRLLTDKGWDVYFSPTTYKAKRRLARNAEWIKSFWIDLDCGDGKDYPTQKEALAAVTGWLGKTNFLKPRFVVSSGYGLHVYWNLVAPITGEHWQRVASAFKRSLRAYGLRADPSRTADRASILRVPGTLNHKKDAPAEVKLLLDTKRDCTIEDFERALPNVGPVSVPDARVPTPKTEFDVDGDYPPADADVVAGKCAQMRQMRDTRGVGPEPWWRAALSVLIRCENGEELCQEWSKGDERFNAAETLDKAKRSLGPATCEHFEDCNPGACAGCPFVGKITSPIILGTPEPEPEAEPEVTEDGEANPYADLPNQVGPYRVTNRGVMRRIEDEDGGYVDEPVTFVPLWVAEVRERARTDLEQDHSTLLLRWHSLDGTKKAGVVPQRVVYSQKDFTTWLADHNLIAQVGKVQGVMQYINTITQEHLKEGRTRRLYDALGWYDEGIVSGPNIITPEGVKPASVKPNSPISRMKKTTGAGQWKAAANLLGRKDTWPQAFALLCSMGSPILSQVDKQGAVVSFHGRSGRGKTMGATFALSLYGNHTPMMQSASTTYKALEEQLARLRHMPHLVDEVTKMHPRTLGDYIYAAANGVGRQGLTRTRELIASEQWQLISMVTTNRPLLERKASEVNEAQQKRIIEVTLPTAIDPEVAVALADARDQCYGSVGGEYLTALLKSKKMLPALFKKAEDAINKHFLLQHENRFAIWTLAAALVGGWVARTVGIINWDPMVPVLRAAGIVAADDYNAPDEEERVVPAINELLTARQGDIIVWGSRDTIAPDYAPREVMARIDYDTGKVWIVASALRDRFAEEEIAFANVKGWFKENGIVSKSRRLAPGAGTVWAHGVPLDLLGIKRGEDNADDC